MNLPTHIMYQKNFIYDYAKSDNDTQCKTFDNLKFEQNCAQDTPTHNRLFERVT